MNGTVKKINMLEGSLAKNMILFAVPLAASTIIQQLFNSADVAVAGHFAGSSALAAVGANAPVISLFISILAGLSLGANVIVARLIGEKHSERISGVIHTSLMFAVILGIIMMAAGMLLSYPLLSIMDTPANVLEEAVLYLRIYCISLPFVVIYNFGSAVLRSMGDTKRPMIILIATGLVNIVLNIVFVIVFKMSVSGVAVATVIANIISAIMILLILMHEEEPYKLRLGKMQIEKRTLLMVLKIGAPAALQGALFSLSNIIVQSGINLFGPDAVAGSSTGLNFEYFTFYIINAFAQTVVTFTSQNYGAANKDRCRRIYRLGMIEGMGFTAILSGIFIITKDFIVLLYTPDPNVIKYAIIRMSLVAGFEALTGLYEISGAAIRGMGNSLLPALITIIGTVCFRFFWVNVVFQASPKFETLMLLYIVSWILTGAIMIPAYLIYRKKAFKLLKAA